jgi:hypothetical protein
MVGQLRRGEGKDVLADLRRFAWSEAEAVGLRFTYGTPTNPPPADVPLTPVPLDAALAAKVFDMTDLSPMDRHYLERRAAMWEAGFGGGWVAVDDHGEPVYLQWLIPPGEHELIKSFFGPLFPDFDGDTLLVEGAWIPPSFRKRHVMAEGLALVTEAAGKCSGPEIRYAQCYPAADNRGAVLGTRSSGYEVNQKRIERWRFGRCTVTFEPACESDFAAFAPR